MKPTGRLVLALCATSFVVGLATAGSTVYGSTDDQVRIGGDRCDPSDLRQANGTESVCLGSVLRISACEEDEVILQDGSCMNREQADYANGYWTIKTEGK